jgi:hypothetical protein
MAESHDHPEYVWRFKLSEGDDEGLHADALTEMVRRELKALLGCVVLTRGGEDLKVTGFRFLGEADAEHAVYPGLPERHSDVETASGRGGDADGATTGAGQEGEAPSVVDRDIDQPAADTRPRRVDSGSHAH